MNDDYEPLVGHFEPIKHGGRQWKIREIEAMGLGRLNVFSQFSTGHQRVYVCVWNGPKRLQQRLDLR